jgi:hypothetical protein
MARRGRNDVVSEKEIKKGGVDILKLCCDWRYHKEPVGYLRRLSIKMWEPLRLKTLRASGACYMDHFIVFLRENRVL